MKNGVKIRLSIGDKNLTAKLLESPARDFASLLPVTLKMNDLFMREKYGHLIFKNRIPESVKMIEALHMHKPIWDYAPNSPVAEAMAGFCNEVFDRLMKKEEAA